MEIKFEKEYLQDLYEKGKTTDKKYRFQPEVINGYAKAIYRLENASNPEELYQYKSLNYEKLQGNKKGISSVRATQKYRIEFTEQNDGIDSTITICNILELSNHYK
ncbi:MAG: type II toxin-antitoxin system RelE/ParE family toxin [Bacteroidales bacterium]|jgi:proteic killer suppression protein|nr:type II toxin-antitoxin system RelE/ParE family toxin [Bacteroidales bacterium]